LQLDHINGINDDNRIENLRILCPNCHSQTTTFAGKNKKKKTGATSNSCNKCKKGISKRAKHCLKCHSKNNEIISWPETSDLIDMVIFTSYVAVAKILGVSDNAIRTRIKNHSKQSNKN